MNHELGMETIQNARNLTPLDFSEDANMNNMNVDQKLVDKVIVQKQVIMHFDDSRCSDRYINSGDLKHYSQIRWPNSKSIINTTNCH